MFCPKCGIENQIDQRFCRGCGHGLAGHRAALDINFEQTIEKIETGTIALFASSLILVVLSLLALAVWLLQKDSGAFAILIPALAIAIPAAIIGVMRLYSGHRTLAGPDRRKKKKLETQAINPNALSAAATDPLEWPQQPSPVSVTENTTLNLRRTRDSSDNAEEPRS